MRIPCRVAAGVVFVVAAETDTILLSLVVGFATVLALRGRVFVFV